MLDLIPEELFNRCITSSTHPRTMTLLSRTSRCLHERAKYPEYWIKAFQHIWWLVKGAQKVPTCSHLPNAHNWKSFCKELYARRDPFLCVTCNLAFRTLQKLHGHEKREHPRPKLQRKPMKTEKTRRVTEHVLNQDDQGTADGQHYRGDDLQRRPKKRSKVKKDHVSDAIKVDYEDAFKSPQQCFHVSCTYLAISAQQMKAPVSKKHTVSCWECKHPQCGFMAYDFS